MKRATNCIIQNSCWCRIIRPRIRKQIQIYSQILTLQVRDLHTDRHSAIHDYHLKKSVSTRSFFEKRIPGGPESCVSPSNLNEVARKLSAWEASRSNSSFLKFGALRNQTDTRLTDCKTKNNESRKTTMTNGQNGAISMKKKNNVKQKGLARKGFHPTKQITKEKNAPETQIVGKLLHQKKVGKSNVKPSATVEMSARLKLHKSNGLDRRNSTEKIERDSNKKRDKSREKSEQNRPYSGVGKLKLVQNPQTASKNALNQSNEQKKPKTLQKNKSERILVQRQEEPRTTVEDKRESEKPTNRITASSRDLKRGNLHSMSQLETKRPTVVSEEQPPVKTPITFKKQKSSTKVSASHIKSRKYLNPIHSSAERKKLIKVIKSKHTSSKPSSSNKSLEKKDKKKPGEITIKHKQLEVQKLHIALNPNPISKFHHSDAVLNNFGGPEESKRASRRQAKPSGGKFLKKKSKKKQIQFHAERTNGNALQNLVYKKYIPPEIPIQTSSEPLAGTRIDTIAKEIKSSASSVREESDKKPTFNRKKIPKGNRNRNISIDEAAIEIQRKWRTYSSKIKDKKAEKNAQKEKNHFQSSHKVSNHNDGGAQSKLNSQPKDNPTRIIPEVPKLQIFRTISDAGAIMNGADHQTSDHKKNDSRKEKEYQVDKGLNRVTKSKRQQKESEAEIAMWRADEESNPTLGGDLQVTHTQYDRIVCECIN